MIPQRILANVSVIRSQVVLRANRDDPLHHPPVVALWRIAATGRIKPYWICRSGVGIGDVGAGGGQFTQGVVSAHCGAAITGTGAQTGPV